MPNILELSHALLSERIQHKVQMNPDMITFTVNGVKVEYKVNFSVYANGRINSINISTDNEFYMFNNFKEVVDKIKSLYPSLTSVTNGNTI